jgi:hypothetical protein
MNVSLNRYSAKRDENEPQIVGWFRELDCEVKRLNGEGVPDLLVSVGGSRGLILVEVKMPGKHLNPKQVQFFNDWHGHCYIARDRDDVVRIVESVS